VEGRQLSAYTYGCAREAVLLELAARLTKLPEGPPITSGTEAAVSGIVSPAPDNASVG
jgi:hypothetical protein